ncbi:MAG: phosphatase PAP2 family protein [Egibacteraceae bacterium]
MRPSAVAWRLAAGAGLLAAGWSALASPRVARADLAAGQTLRDAGGPAVDRAVVATTDFGSVYAVLSASAVLAALGRRGDAADVAGVGLSAWACSEAAKRVFDRRRPYEADGTRRLLRPPAGSSFPSGHATVATAVGLTLAEGATHSAGRALLTALGPQVAASRVYAGVHYPSDVIGGTGLGTLLATAWRGPLGGLGRWLVARTATVSAALARGLGAALAAGARRWRARRRA